MLYKNRPIKLDATLKWATIIFLIGIVLVSIAPLLFTRQYYWEGFDFRETGPIGDTIGGITAPFVNLIGAILVYFALHAQVKANRLVQEQIDNQKEEEVIRRKLQYAGEKFNLVRNDVNEFTYHFRKTITKGAQSSTERVTYTGVSAIRVLLDQLKDYKNHEDIYSEAPPLKELYNLLSIIDALIDNINQENFLQHDKDFYKSLIFYLFNSKIKPAFKANEDYRSSIKPACSGCGKKHLGIPDDIFELVETIDKKVN
ncbi:hypothetical protein [Adhaeribacter rhizoryzae]|uniref:Phage abortive infection protein n=1 Tax=Adhaeribacter rhizoryzae TaxID=2607907 RepID=A0A5M6CYG7_9BACT|nr:hypothetical protein [Adhaeribacter rhizoryzae]KAA5539042.1 hypothetical protein F0145_25225 [Adhaeribacter rhizoryzae]